MRLNLKVIFLNLLDEMVESLLVHLRQAGYEPEWMRVDSIGDLCRQILGEHWDVILSDSILPGHTI